MTRTIALCISLCVLLSMCGCRSANDDGYSEILEIISIYEDVPKKENSSTSNTNETVSSSPDKTHTESSNTNNGSSAMNTESSKVNTSSIIESDNIICVSPKNKSTVSILNEDMISYLSQKYTPAKMDEYFTGKDNFAPKSVKLSWSVSGSKPSNYQIEVSLNNDMSNSVTYSSNNTELTLYNLFAAKTYYWRIITTQAKQTIRSKIFSFSTENYIPRTIYAEGVSNTRDIGGWSTASGKKVKQGMIYRGAKLNDITENGKKTMLNSLGIKMDLDLRNSSETGGSHISPLGMDVLYCNISFPYYALGSNTSINDSGTHEAIATVMSVLANPDNYPVYLHCSIGRDRTGTLVSLINGLLGVSEEDLAKDYELSYFAGCFGANPIPMRDMLPKFLTIPDYIKTYNGKTYSESVEKFLLKIGVSKSDINSIRSIMLE